jgi:hypothetical protein
LMVFELKKPLQCLRKKEQISNPQRKQSQWKKVCRGV